MCASNIFQQYPGSGTIIVTGLLDQDQLPRVVVGIGVLHPTTIELTHSTQRPGEPLGNPWGTLGNPGELHPGISVGAKMSVDWSNETTCIEMVLIIVFGSRVSQVFLV